MRYLTPIPVVLMLTGCGPTFPTIDGEALKTAMAQVRGHTVAICQYLPSNESLVGILTASFPVVETAYDIAKQICSAVTEVVPPLSPVQQAAPRLGDEEQCPMVRGVCIEGKFIQPAPGTPGNPINPHQTPDRNPNQLPPEAAP